MATLRIADLHPAYAAASLTDAVAMANLGAVCWSVCREELQSAWADAMSAEEGAKADVWRAEGRMGAVEEFKARLVAGDVAISRIATIEASAEGEVARRVDEQIAYHRKAFELEKREALLVLETQMAELRGQSKSFRMLEEAHTGMREMIESLQAELAKYKAAATTKSSHALGKIGEAAVLDILNTYVIPRFPYAEVRDMTAVKHAGDFHLSVFGPTGKRVKIMLDSKKYASPVQNVEVDKMFSDLDGDDSEAGILISLDSAICNKSQFQIVRTKHSKPCIFLTFEKLDDGIRQEVLCWAIRALVSIVATYDQAAQDTMIAEIQAFMTDLGASMVELDGCVKSSKALHDMLKAMRDRLVARITSFKAGGADVVQHVVEPSDGEDMRCKALNASGTQCKSRRIPTKSLCTRHDAMVAEGKNVPVGGGA
jgi:hypothetical protein